jgi:hypothetical protein
MFDSGDYKKYYCTPVAAIFKKKKAGKIENVSIKYEQIKSANLSSIIVSENKGRNKFNTPPLKPFWIRVTISENVFNENIYYFFRIDQNVTTKQEERVRELEEEFFKNKLVLTDEERAEEDDLI